MSAAVRPEDVLADGQERATMGGVAVRKGTVAAFVANARLLGELDPGDPDRPVIEAQLRTLLPMVAAAGVFEVFELRSPQLRQVCGLG